MHFTLAHAALSAVAALAAPAAVLNLADIAGSTSKIASVETVEIKTVTIDYPLPGEFLASGRPAPAPVVQMDVPAFHIMKRQVSLADYGRCVAAGACDAPDTQTSTEDVPVTGVSWLDTQAFIKWYSETTGDVWRLPTAQEAAAAAAERFKGDAFAFVVSDPGNPATAWLHRYREEAAAKRAPDPRPWPHGHFGANSNGLEDFGGNIWEWTSTCFNRVTLNPATGKAESTIGNCGVHVLEGLHRAYMSDFVRDGKSGGCAVGTPPENLGFRLVREERSLMSRIKRRLRDGVGLFRSNSVIPVS